MVQVPLPKLDLSNITMGLAPLVVVAATQLREPAPYPSQHHWIGLGWAGFGLVWFASLTWMWFGCWTPPELCRNRAVFLHKSPRESQKQRLLYKTKVS